MLDALQKFYDAGDKYVHASCHKCRRNGSYYIKRALEAYGNLPVAKLIEGLTLGCERRIAANPLDPCVAVLVGLKDPPPS